MALATAAASTASARRLLHRLMLMAGLASSSWSLQPRRFASRDATPCPGGFEPAEEEAYCEATNVCLSTIHGFRKMMQDAKTLAGHLRRLQHGENPNMTDFFNNMLAKYFRALSSSRKDKVPWLSGTTLLFSVCHANDCALPWKNVGHWSETLFPMFGSREARDAKRIWLWQTTAETWHKLEQSSDWYRMGVEAILSGRPIGNDLEEPIVFGGSDYCFERLVVHMEPAVRTSNTSRPKVFFKSEELCHNFSARAAEVVSAAPAVSVLTDAPLVKVLLRTDAQGWRNYQSATADIGKFVLSQGGRFEVIQLKRSSVQVDTVEGLRTKEDAHQDLNENYEDTESDLALEWYARPRERDANTSALALASTSTSMRQLTLKEQIEAVSTADVLISTHGAQDTNLAFLRKGSAFIEVYHCLHRSPDFLDLSRSCGILYYEARTTTYHHEPTCDPVIANKTSRRYLESPTDLDFERDLQPTLARALKEWKKSRRR